MFFKEYVQRRAIDKLEQSGNSKYHSVQEIESVGFLFNMEEDNILETVKRLIEILDNRSIKFKALAINRQKRSYLADILDYRIKVLHKRRFRYGDIPLKNEIDHFLDQSFSTFIDFGPNHHFANYYIARATNADFKIGRVSYDPNPFDLIIDVADGNHRGYLNSLIHYLSAIKSN